MPRLAFYTFGLLRQPVGQPEMNGFMERAGQIFERANDYEGFIRLHDGWEAIPRFADPTIATAAQTLSLWHDLESVYAFAYQGVHAEALRQRKAWFVKGDWPTYVAWWVGDDEEPTYHEAVERFEHLYDHGPTPYAFNFRTSFDDSGQPVTITRRFQMETDESRRNPPGEGATPVNAISRD